ncbi:hypothetical protein D8Y22_13285 [Salinadaptatus halalkaliphilus]|uniref:Uncharacterized protein n=1 Tax=Salinadaptatus halalkaliphilus TaxID=2419781 RepID=A0A4S3TJV0_9EURY|nr:hypothetical protein [Salinadaptatus halalkaliphilus]THE64379.1 hypothetical protein D8Y22_13285 [Salinadaptatus halalkaliphilus]
MDFEAPADAWYVYVGVAIISVVVAGLAVGVSTGPPPDAEQASSAIEGATGSEYAASGSYEHDAEIVTIDHQTLTMENDHGTAHSSFAYGTVVPVNGHERLENIAYGQSFEDAYADELDDPTSHATLEFFAAVEDADAENSGRELYADGELTARTVAVRNDEAVAVSAEPMNDADLSEDFEDEFEDEDDVESIPADFYVQAEGKAIAPMTVELEASEQPDLENDETLLEALFGVVGAVFDWDESVVDAVVDFWNDYIWCRIDPGVDCPDYDVEFYQDHDAEVFVSHSGETASEHVRPLAPLEDVEDLEALETEDVWLGTFPVDVEIRYTGGELLCAGTLEDWDDSVECGPDMTLEDYDEPHWHETRGDVHYVTLVTV